MHDYRTNGMLLCPHCGYEHVHLVASVMFFTDEYEATHLQVTLGNTIYTLPSNFRYNFRSQGNIHVLFRGECDHYFFVSFDGRKGIVYVNDNDLVQRIENALNDAEIQQRPIKYPTNQVCDTIRYVIDQEIAASKKKDTSL